MIEPLASELLSVDRIDVQDRAALHKRYRIDGVPTTLLADPDGVVTKAFFGPMAQEELDEALAANGLGRPSE